MPHLNRLAAQLNPAALVLSGATLAVNLNTDPGVGTKAEPSRSNETADPIRGYDVPASPHVQAKFDQNHDDLMAEQRDLNWKLRELYDENRLLQARLQGIENPTAKELNEMTVPDQQGMQKDAPSFSELAWSDNMDNWSMAERNLGRTLNVLRAAVYTLLGDIAEMKDINSKLRHTLLWKDHNGMPKDYEQVKVIAPHKTKENEVLSLTKDEFKPAVIPPLSEMDTLKLWATRYEPNGDMVPSAQEQARRNDLEQRLFKTRISPKLEEKTWPSVEDKYYEYIEYATDDDSPSSSGNHRDCFVSEEYLAKSETGGGRIKLKLTQPRPPGIEEGKDSDDGDDHASEDTRRGSLSASDDSSDVSSVR